MSQFDEQALLIRVQKLEQTALTEVHERYHNAIFRYISFRVSDYATCEDLTSEVFVRLLHAVRERSAPRNTLRGWLYGTAKRVVQDYYRKIQRMPEVKIDDNLPGGSEPLGILEKQFKREDLGRALRTLTEDQQHVLGLRFGHGLSIRDVAEALNKTEGAIKMLQARAIAALSKLLVEEGKS